MTAQRRVADISDVETQLPEIFDKCVYCSLAVDESAETT
jgi:hypothetical protein